MKKVLPIVLGLCLFCLSNLWAATPSRKVLNDLHDIAGFYAAYSIPIDSCSNLELYRRIHHYLGTPYKSRSRSGGFDCSGFTKTLYREVYDKRLQGGSADIFPKTRPLAKEELMEGDMVFFKIRKGRISHVGVYLGNGRFVHAATRGGVRIDSLEDPYYKRTFFLGGRL
jgi:lipoprotein Spr